MESVDDQYINVVRYKLIKGSSYFELSPELRNPAKGLINLQNNDNECFRWYHIRHSNPQQKDPQRIKKLDYINVTFPVARKDYRKIEIMNNININVLGYEKQERCPVYMSREKFNDKIYCSLQREKSNTTYSSKTSISLCTTIQNTHTESIFAGTVYSVLNPK